MKRLTCVISSLGCGGAEAVLTRLANSWAENGIYAITFLTLAGHDKDFHRLHPSINRISIADAQGHRFRSPVGRNVERQVALRRTILSSRPDTILSFGDSTNVRTILATSGFSARLVISERNNPLYQAITPVWGLLRRLLYARADLLVVQTSEVAEWGRKVMAPSRVRVVPNPVSKPHSNSQRCPGVSSEKIVLAVGTLTHRKGHDLLLRSFQTCWQRNPDWRLCIVGDGELREDLAGMVRSLGLGEAVDMPGRVADPSSYYNRASIFVLSSRHEGFPNALCEAMAHGLPAVSFDCPSGPRDIVRHGIDGLLVPAGDIQGMASSIFSLMQDPERRRQLASRAPDVVERFSFNRISAEWLALLGNSVEL